VEKAELKKIESLKSRLAALEKKLAQLEQELRELRTPSALTRPA